MKTDHRQRSAALDWARKHGKKAKRDGVMTVVYVMKANKYTKVGLAEDVAKRLQVLRSHSPVPVELVYCSPRMLRPLARELELHCHSELMNFHCHGEWFEVDANEAVKVIGEKVGFSVSFKTPVQLELVA